jgi:hypothetical protein
MGTSVERRPDKLKPICTENHSFPTDCLLFSSCTFGLMLRLRSAQVQKYQKIKAFQKWLKTGERFGRKKRRLLHFHPTEYRCTKISRASPAIIASVSSLFFRCLFS